MADDRPPEQAPQAPPAPPPGPPQIESTADDRTMALVAHLVGGLIGFLVPLIVWLIKKDQSKFVDDQGKEALNFQLSILLAHFVLLPMMCIPFVNILILLCHLGLRVFSAIFGIIAGMAAQKGEVYRYPCTLRLIK